MTSLGMRLKEARIAKGLTLDDLQYETKIQKRFLAGIEDENFSMMPGAFYVRVFIKQYSEAVGLDSEEMLALYQEEHGDIIQEERQKAVPPVLQRSTAGLQRNARLQEMLPKVIVALFIVIILAIIYILLRDKATETGLESDPLNSGDTVIEQPAEQPTTDSNKEVVQKLEHASTSGETTTYTLKHAEKVNLVIKTSGDSWISVTD
ncbi:helix-turn-helix domain-containing protein [Sporosarcina sp. GW1-11]|uniref:helix-turn-helix domain-containing protein n=1 Tax=Sporosarcina sp. GW1-11 TaxID=2899126 RepID=UPI00294CE906|nr:helix-turn-helix domain-containing protein [Sporosarcina sp. GW1-11]MDV6376649.1 helix-turn-helix domain-containing protein [Sporosarcina sp. GW1-11]